MSKTKNKPMQKVLAFIFAFSFIVGFFIIDYTADYFQGNGAVNEVALWRSDSSANFGVMDIENSPDPDYYETFRTGKYERYAGPTYYGFNRTPVYTGNLTWSISVNASSGSANWGQFVIALPDLDQWIISGWNITFTKPADVDLTMIMDTYSPADNTLAQTGETSGTNIFTNFGLGTGTAGKVFENRTLDRAIALDVYDKAQESDNHYLSIQIIDRLQDGIGAWSFELSLTINGQPVSQFDLEQAVIYGLAIASGLNIVIALYMTDQIDLGGYVKDLGKKRRRSK